jgi:error-prone DNA polymerase
MLQGSGTGSLLCYALGISPVDPLTAEALVFERFAGRHRGIGDLPDLDFGIPAGREGEVRRLLQEMFGAERVSFLAAVVTLQERGAIRTAASAFGWDRHQIRLLREKLKAGDALDRHEQMVVNAGRQIAGQPSHLMRHPSGVIVSEEPLVSLYGVGRCSEGPMLQANKDDVEALQLLKFDILPWYLLAIYDQAENSIHASHYPKLDLWHVAGTDERTGDMLEQADTRCIPYLQSPAMMTIMRALKVRTETDIALALGALRPGASHTRERLMAAIHGGTAVLPGWERLTVEHQAAIEGVLAPSRGALIYDEDLLRLANLLGLSFADAERLRKAMGKGATDGPLINKLRASALAGGWTDREIEVILHWFTFIQRYTFTKGHAVAMAHAAWRVARLAVHYPAHFYAGVLDNLGLGTGGGMYPVLVYVVEARRHGVELRGPTVNGPWISQTDGRVVQCGLRVLRGAINEATLQRIHETARHRPFASVTDLCTRLDLAPHDLERLIAAGALDELAASRRHARWEMHFAHGRSPEQSSLLDARTWPEPPILDAESPEERAAEEYATLGFTLSLAHPLALVEHELADLRLIQAVCLRSYIGRWVQVAGVVVAGRRIHTNSGRLMTFASLCDATATIELTLFEAVAARYSDAMYEGGLIVADGIVTDHPEHGTGLDVRMVRRVASLVAERPVAELDPDLVP